MWASGPAAALIQPSLLYRVHAAWCPYSYPPVQQFSSPSASTLYIPPPFPILFLFLCTKNCTSHAVLPTIQIHFSKKNYEKSKNYYHATLKFAPNSLFFSLLLVFFFFFFSLILFRFFLWLLFLPKPLILPVSLSSLICNDVRLEGMPGEPFCRTHSPGLKGRKRSVRNSTLTAYSPAWHRSRPWQNTLVFAFVPSSQPYLWHL